MSETIFEWDVKFKRTCYICVKYIFICGGSGINKSQLKNAAKMQLSMQFHIWVLFLKMFRFYDHNDFSIFGMGEATSPGSFIAALVLALGGSAKTKVPCHSTIKFLPDPNGVNAVHVILHRVALHNQCWRHFTQIVRFSVYNETDSRIFTLWYDVIVSCRTT